MLRSEHASWCSVYIPFNCFQDSLLGHSTGRRQDLNRIARDDNILTFNYPTPRLQIIKNRFEANKLTSRAAFKYDENINIERRYRLQIERRPHRPADRVAIDDSVRLH